MSMVMKPPEPLIHQFDDLDALSIAAADQFCCITRDAVAARGLCTIALAGGSTPRRLYELMATPAYRDRVRWDKLEFFWGDERIVPPENEDSNFRMANETLLKKIPVKEIGIHRIPAENGTPDDVARRYEEEIAVSFGIAGGGPPPTLDLIVLGMGTDGHTASLFPHSPALRATERWVVPSRAPRPPYDRVTMTAPVINAARQVIFLVAGTDKSPTLAQVLDGPLDPDRLPSQLIAPSNGSLLWLIDSAAASQLRGTGLPGGIRV
jgi:6-phosphogluconolactonase